MSFRKQLKILKNMKKLVIVRRIDKIIEYSIHNIDKLKPMKAVSANNAEPVFSVIPNPIVNRIVMG
jgi:hypothetical protein